MDLMFSNRSLRMNNLLIITVHLMHNNWP